MLSQSCPGGPPRSPTNEKSKGTLRFLIEVRPRGRPRNDGTQCRTSGTGTVAMADSAGEKMVERRVGCAVGQTTISHHDHIRKESTWGLETFGIGWGGSGEQRFRVRLGAQGSQSCTSQCCCILGRKTPCGKKTNTVPCHYSRDCMRGQDSRSPAALLRWRG